MTLLPAEGDYILADVGCQIVTGEHLLAQLSFQDQQGQIFEPILENTGIKPATFGGDVAGPFQPSSGPGIIHVQSFVDNVGGHNVPLARATKHHRHS